MSLDIRTVYHSPKHLTLLLEQESRKLVYRLDSPEDVERLFHQLGFPEGKVASGIKIEEAPLGPVLLLHRTYVQKMPGDTKPGRLIWCCLVRPDQAAGAPEVLTPAEAKSKYQI